MATPVTLTAGTLAEGYCFTTVQQYYEDIIAATTAELQGTSNTFNFGNSTPAAEDQDKPWIYTDASGNLIGVYTYNGQWVRPHPAPPSAQERRLWVGTEADLWAYDGGDGTDPGTSPPTDTTGAMWEVDDNFAFKIPIGAGTNATAYNGEAATNINVGGTLGAEKVALESTELAAHTHAGEDDNRYVMLKAGGPIETPEDTPGWGIGAWNTASAGGNVDGSTRAHQNMPPVYGVHIIKRTARRYFVV